MTMHVHVVDGLTDTAFPQARALTVEYLALTDAEAGLPVVQGFDGLRPPLQDVVHTLADRHQPPGALLLALVDGRPCGIVAMRRSTVSTSRSLPGGWSAPVRPNEHFSDERATRATQAKPSDALVQRLYVPASCRRLGVARALMTTVHECATQAGFKRMVLAVMPSRTGAIALYRSLGYMPLTDDVDWGWDAVGLARDL